METTRFHKVHHLAPAYNRNKDVIRIKIKMKIGCGNVESFVAGSLVAG
jgi:hypothetical protein